MKRIVLSALAVLPLAATAQSAKLPGTRALDSALVPHVATLAAPAPAPAVPHLNQHQVIRTVVAPDFANPLLSNKPELSFEIGAPGKVEKPVLTSYHAVVLSNDVMATVPANTTVAVKVLVDRAGKPLFPQIVRSAGPAVDRAALAAVSDFRFSPAKVDYLPIDSRVTLEVEITKQ